MAKRIPGLVMFVALVVAALLAGGADAPAAEPQPLRVYLFASSTCPECAAIKGELLPRLEAVHGARIEVTHLDLEDIENFKLLLLYEKHYGSKDDEALKVFVGDAFLSGAKAITEKLERTVSDQLAKGAVTPTPGAMRAEAKGGKP